MSKFSGQRAIGCGNRLPEKFVRRGSKPLCIGQKQRWFILRLDGIGTITFRWIAPRSRSLTAGDGLNSGARSTRSIYFKRRVYARALHELGPHLYPQGLPPRPRWWPKRWRAVFDKDLARDKIESPGYRERHDYLARTRTVGKRPGTADHQNGLTTAKYHDGQQEYRRQFIEPAEPLRIVRNITGRKTSHPNANIAGGKRPCLPAMRV